MSEDEKSERNDDDKENLEDSRADTSMSNSTFMSNSGRIENKDANVDPDGFLNLSQLNLTNLSRMFTKEYSRVTHLNVSDNAIQSFTYMKMFPECNVIIANDCQISKFIPNFNQKLEKLVLSRNQLKNVENFARFGNLKMLDLSYNHIEEHVLLSFKLLEHLNLAGNLLTQLPDLRKCPQLSSIDISKNQISDLTNISTLICRSHLTKFDISSNCIDDLTQFSLLSDFSQLTHVCIVNNPSVIGLKFDYRIYIFASLRSEKIENIDGEIDDNVRTQGEWMAIQGKKWNFGPGNHQKICDFINSQFPSTDDGPLTPAQKECTKALKKRHQSSGPAVIESDRSVNSDFSAHQEWNQKLEKWKDHANRHSIGSTMRTPVKRDFRMCSPPESRKNKSYTFKNSSPSSQELTYSPQPHSYSRTNSTDTVILSSRTETCISIDERNEITPLPGIDDPLKVHEERKNTPSTIDQRSPSVADVSVVLQDDKDTKERISVLEEKVAQLALQNAQLTDINQGLVEMLEVFKSDQEKIMRIIKSSIPKPQNMTASLLGEDEDGLQTHIVRWDMPSVQGFEIHVDGNFCGKVIGRNNTARITDLDSSKPHVVQVQTIGLSGERGEISEKLYIQQQ